MVRNIQYNEELARKNEELTHLDQLKSDFMATMSHELRTPLTSIIGYSDMLLSGMTGELNEKQSAFVDSILKGGEALLNLINDVLDLTKIEAGRLELNREAVDLRAALLGVLPVVKPRAQDKRIRISTFLPTDLPLVWADPGKLNQVLLNLLTNGIKYTHENGSVSVEARTAGRARRDLGHRHRHRHRPGGPGQGLPALHADRLVGHALAGRHRPRARHREGAGGAPRRRPSACRASSERAPASSSPCRYRPSRPIRWPRARSAEGGAHVARAILVADDDPDILSIVSMSLETQGYTVHKATNGREAVDLARQHHPDLILMDMMMPVVSGYEAVGELKADATTKDIVIVGLSAKAMATDMERATDVGIDGYITKPFRIAQVLTVVESYLSEPGGPVAGRRGRSRRPRRRTPRDAQVNHERSTTPQPPLICVADVDTRLSCSCYCAVCPYYLRDRRIGERRTIHRPTLDRRVFSRFKG